MNLKQINQADRSTLVLSGQIDVSAAEEMASALAGVLETGARELELDFNEVSFIGSSGIGKLLHFYKEFSARGGSVLVSNLNPDLQALFKAIKLDTFFKLD